MSLQEGHFIFKKSSEKKRGKNGAGVTAPPAAAAAGGAGVEAGELAAISSPSHARKQRGLAGVRAGLVAVEQPGVEHGGGPRLFT